MEPKFQTSFIPKKSITEASGTQSSKEHSSNIFSIISTAIFVLTLLAYGGLYIYKNSVKNQIVQADKDLNDARKVFQVDTIQDLIDANDRIMAIKSLLNKHTVVYKILTLLQTLTAKDVRFSDFAYTNKGGVSIIMAGESRGYNAMAFQSDIFSKSEYIKDQSFSEFSLSENGNVKFKISLSLDPGLVSYKKSVEPASPDDKSQ